MRSGFPGTRIGSRPRGRPSLPRKVPIWSRLMFWRTTASTLQVPSVASQSTSTGGDRKQVHPLRSPVPSFRGKANRHHSTRVFGSHVVLDNDRSRKQAARFQGLLQQPSHAQLTGRPNARYAAVTTSRKSPIVSMATTVSGPLSDTGGCLISQRFVLAAVSARPLQKP